MTNYRPIAIRTLGDVLASPSYTLWANCDQCSRGVKLDPQKLAATYGADLAIADLKRRLKCSQCGRHTYSVTLGFDMGPGTLLLLLRSCYSSVQPAVQKRDAMHVPRQRTVVSLCVAVLVLISSCDQEEQRKLPALTVAQWLDACSPFESLDGAAMLMFRMNDHSVWLTEATGEERARGLLRRKIRRSPKETGPQTTQ